MSYHPAASALLHSALRATRSLSLAFPALALDLVDPLVYVVANGSTPEMRLAALYVGERGFCKYSILPNSREMFPTECYMLNETCFIPFGLRPDTVTPDTVTRIELCFQPIRYTLPHLGGHPACVSVVSRGVGLCVAPPTDIDARDARSGRGGHGGHGGRGSPTSPTAHASLEALAIRLACELWQCQPRTFPRLRRVLSHAGDGKGANGGGRDGRGVGGAQDNIESVIVRVARAASIRGEIFTTV